MKLSIATVLSFAATAAAYQPAPATFSLGNFGKKKDAKKAPAKVSFGKDVMMTSLWLAGSGSFVITVGGSDEWIQSLRGSLREYSSLLHPGYHRQTLSPEETINIGTCSTVPKSSVSQYLHI